MWPPAGIEPLKLLWPIIGTIVLLASIIPMQRADSGIKHGKQGQLKLGLAIGFVLGAVFIGTQIRKYSRETFGFGDNSYSSLFYGITGLHGIHVISALMMNLVVQVRAWLGHFGPRRRLAVQNAVLYSHFVDVVWIFVFASLYLSPRWL